MAFEKWKAKLKDYILWTVNPLQVEIEKQASEIVALKEALAECEKRLCIVEENVCGNNERLLTVEENLRGNNDRLLAAEENLRGNNDCLLAVEENLRGNNDRLLTVEENLRSNNDRLLAMEENARSNNDRLLIVEENTRGNNSKLEQLGERDIKTLEVKMAALRTQIKKLSENTVVRTDSVDVSENSIENTYDDIDYFKFENYFRGSEELIKDRQKVYLSYFDKCNKVLDLGCGRGEFLELLQENGITAKGIDFYEEFVIYNQDRGLNVEGGDAIAYLENLQDKVDGIFAGQLVEHLTTGQIIALCEKAYEKLEDGKYLIMETPNPTSLAMFTHAFYIDPSHQKPVHPLTLKYFVEQAGFSEVQILFTEGSKLAEKIPALEGNGITNLEEFNASMKQIEDYLYGSQDYAIIAKK